MSDDTTTTDFKAKFQRLVELREERDMTKTAAKNAEKAYREYEAELFAETEEAGMEGRFGWDFGSDLGTAKFNRRRTFYGRVLDKESALKALREAGILDTIIEDHIREGRLNELVRDRLESGQDMPEGIDWYAREGITISRR